MTLFGTLDHTGYQFSMQPPDHWRLHAACIEAENPEIFEVIPQEGDGVAAHEQNAENLKLALAFCERCPVKTDCLDDADEFDLMYTVRGGRRPLSMPMRTRGRPPKAEKRPDNVCSKGHVDKWIVQENGRRRCADCKTTWRGSLGGPKGRQVRDLRDDEVAEHIKVRHAEHHPDHNPRWRWDSDGYVECRECRNITQRARRASTARRRTAEENHALKGLDHEPQWRTSGASGRKCRICDARAKRVARAARML